MGDDDHKTKLVVPAPTPTSKMDLRSFLALAPYYRRFIKSSAKVAALLHVEISVTTELSLSTEMKILFETLKKTRANLVSA